MSLRDIENMPLADLRARRAELIDEAAKEDPAELALRFVNARVDAKAFDETNGRAGQLLSATEGALEDALAAHEGELAKVARLTDEVANLERLLAERQKAGEKVTQDHRKEMLRKGLDHAREVTTLQHSVETQAVAHQGRMAELIAAQGDKLAALRQDYEDSLATRQAEYLADIDRLTKSEREAREAYKRLDDETKEFMASERAALRKAELIAQKRAELAKLEN